MEYFSEREAKIIKIVSKKSTTISEIIKKLFKKDELLDPKIAVANSISRIIKKCDHHKLDWTLDKTREEGPLTISRVER